MSETPTKSVPFFQQISTMKWNFWICNTIEAFERLAFFGVRAVLPLYMYGANSKLDLTMTQKGQILGIWAFIQCIVPMVSGGYTDSYGYRKSMYVAFLINIVGYLTMGYATGFWSMLGAACLVGTGTAIFKPPVQGAVAKSLDKSNSGLGFGIFYWMVNVGGFFAPLIASVVRGDENNPTWDHVFYGAAIVTAINFLPATFLFREPKLDPEAKKKKPAQVFKDTMMLLWRDQPMLRFLLIISGFWFMFMLLWDLLPNFIDEWVDTRDVAGFLPTVDNLTSWIPGIKEGWTNELLKADGAAKPEVLINIDAFTILLLVLPLSWFFGRYKMMTAMSIGMGIALVGYVCAGLSMAGTFVAAMIFVFAIGEIICSPKFTEYIGMIAPPDKKAIYLGYSNIPFAIGWGLGNALSGPLYDKLANKSHLAINYMVDKLGMARKVLEDDKVMNPKLLVEAMAARMDGAPVDTVAEVAKQTTERLKEIDELKKAGDITAEKAPELIKEAMEPIQALSTETTVYEATALLWNTYNPWIIWIILGTIGLASVIGMLVTHARSKKGEAVAGASSAEE